MAARLTVLYGASGVGKSSVLRAGAVHHLREEAREGAGFVVALYASWSDADPIEGIAEAVREAVADVLGADPGDKPGTLAERLAAWGELVGDVYLVLDQVDEYFLYHGAGGGPLLDELPVLVNEPGLRVNVLLGVREDALAHLDVFKPRIPNLFANYLRLERLGMGAARAAIVGPLEAWSALAGGTVEIEPALVDAILDAVRVGSISGNGGAPQWESQSIEPPYLQIVMERLWNAERAAGSTVLRVATLERLGGARRIVSEHLDRALEPLSAGERDTAAAMFAHLVTPSGAKVAHEVADLAGYAAVGEPEARRVADTLVEERILRPVEGSRGDGARVEIFHDVLASAVADWRRRHDAERALEAEREASRRRHRRLLVVVVVALLALAAMTAVAVYAIVQQQNASDAQRAADAREQAARALVASPTDPVDALRSAVDAAGRSDSPSVAEILRTVLQGVRQTGTFGDGKTPVNAAAFLGGRIVTGDERGRVTVYRADGSREAELRAPAPVEVVATSPDGLLLVGAGKRLSVSRTSGSRCCSAVRTIRLDAPVQAATLEAGAAPRRFAAAAGRSVGVWDRQGSSLWRRRLPGSATSLSLDREGLLVATHTAAWLFAAGSGKPIATFRFPRSDTLHSAAYSEQLGLVATGHKSHAARLWDARSGKLLQTLEGHSGAIVDLAFARQGEASLATASTDGTVRLWSPARRLGRTRLTGVLSGHPLQVHSVAFGPGGEILTTGTDGTARVWTRDGQTLAILAGHSQPPTGGELGRRLALTWSPDGTARTWVWSPDPSVTRVGAFSGELASAAVTQGAAVGALRDRGRAELVVGRRVEPLPAVPVLREVRSVAIGADGSKAATGHERGAALWSTASGARQRVLAQPQPVPLVALSPDGRVLVTGGEDGRLRVWDGGRPPRGIATGLGMLVAGAVSADRRYVGAGDARGVAGVWELSSGKLVTRLTGHTHALTGMAFSADSRFVGTTSYDQDARIWRVDDGSLVHRLSHLAVASGVAFSPDGAWVVTAGPQRAVLWDMRTGNRVLKLAGTGRFLAVAFSADGRAIRTVDVNGIVGSYRCQVCGSIGEVRAAAQARLRRLAR